MDTVQTVVGYPVDATHSIVYEPALQRAQRLVTIKASRSITLHLQDTMPYDVKMQFTVYSPPMKTSADCDKYICSKILELHAEYKGLVIHMIQVTVKD